MIAFRHSEVPSVDHGKIERVTTDASPCVQLTTKAEYYTVIESHFIFILS